MTGRTGLDRCREELAAARLLADKGFEAQAISRAYFAAFFAAETALLVLDEEAGRLLRSLFERRNEADYSPVDVPLDEANAAIRDAGRVVGAVEEWLTHHG